MNMPKKLSFHDKRVMLLVMKTLGCQIAIISIFFIVCAIVKVCIDMIDWVMFLFST
jgi:hypothetical protein